MDSVGQCRGWGLRDVSLMFWIKLVTGLQGATAGERKRVYNITKETICKKNMYTYLYDAFCLA